MNWNSTEFVWLDWAVLAIGVIGVIWAVWHAIVKDRKAQKGEDSSAYLFGKGEPWYVIGMAIRRRISFMTAYRLPWASHIL